MQAITRRNIPAVDIACGRMGIVEDKPVLQIQEALLSLVRHLQIQEGKPAPVENPVMIPQRTSVSSEHEGFFYSDLTSGDYVKKSMKLGYHHRPLRQSGDRCHLPDRRRYPLQNLKSTCEERRWFIQHQPYRLKSFLKQVRQNELPFLKVGTAA
ncbi:hypothetical protein GCM10027443_25660 [Pontibacter brevis]